MKKLSIDWLVALIGIACLIVAGLLAGCGGGEMTPEEKVQHEQDVKDLAVLAQRMTIQPVNCSAGACK